jgi:hypothetical protein
MWEGEISDELVDTREGFTYKVVWCEVENGKYTFYQRHYGVHPEPTEEIDDPEEIRELMEAVNEKNSKI